MKTTTLWTLVVICLLVITLTKVIIAKVMYNDMRCAIVECRIMK